MIQTFDEYLSLRYNPLETELLQKIGRHIARELPTIRKFLLEELRNALRQACEIQRVEGQPCAYISVSLLNTSLVNGTPILQVDFYNSDWVYGSSWARYRISADFLFTHWLEFMEDALDEKFYVRSQIAKVDIKALFLGTVDKIIFLFACYFKYFAVRVSYFDEFDELVKAEHFYLTCGTYLDWQNRMFAVLPEINLLNPDVNEDTTFRTVKKKIYRNKTFNNLDLRGCYFEECRFDNVTFENINAFDARFLQCRFTATKFINLKLAGCDLFECYFKDCTFENCSSEIAKDVDEYFAPMRMYHCFLLNLSVDDNCEFENLVQEDCFTKE